MFDKLLRRLANFEANRVQDLLALAPGEHEECDDESDEQGEPAAVKELGGGRGKKDQVEDEWAAVHAEPLVYGAAVCPQNWR